MRSLTTAIVAGALLLGVSSLAIAADNTSGGPTPASAAISGAVTGTTVTPPMAAEATKGQSMDSTVAPSTKAAASGK